MLLSSLLLPCQDSLLRARPSVRHSYNITDANPVCPQNGRCMAAVWPLFGCLLHSMPSLQIDINQTVSQSVSQPVSQAFRQADERHHHSCLAIRTVCSCGERTEAISQAIEQLRLQLPIPSSGLWPPCLHLLSAFLPTKPLSQTVCQSVRQEIR